MRLGIPGIAIVALAGWQAGCEQFSLAPAQPPTPVARPAVARPAANDAGNPPLGYMAGSAVRGAPGGPSAVATALELSEKYAKVAEELLEAQKANKAVAQENKKLLAQMARLQMELEQLGKELADANETVVEQEKKLQEWKKNVLGFRTEMQQAQQVQLDALRKIMVLLGGQEVRPKAPPAGKPAISSKDAQRDLSNKPSS